MKRRVVASVQNIERRVENNRGVEILLEIFAGKKIEELVFLPGAAHIAAEDFTRVRIVLAAGKVGAAGRFVAKVAEDLAVKIVGGGFRQSHSPVRQRPVPRKVASNDWLDLRPPARAPTGTFVVVAPTVSSVTSMPSTCIRVVRPLRPTMDAAGSPLLEGASISAVEKLHSGFEPGQIEKAAIGGKSVPSGWS